MTTRSERHDEVPKWQSKHFCWDDGEMLWMGFKDTREVKPVNFDDAFVRECRQINLVQIIIARIWQMAR